MSIIRTIDGKSSTPAKSPGKGTDSILFIFTGESNSGGLAVNADCNSRELEPRLCLQILNNTTLTLQSMQIGVNNLIGHTGLPDNATHGWENGLADLVDAGQFYQSQVYLLKTGQGGSMMYQWALGDTYMNTFTSRHSAITTLLSGKTYRKVIFYSQGINDAISGTDPDTWKAATVTHFSDMRNIVGANTPILITRLMTPGQTGNYALYNAKFDEICASDPYSFMIDTSGAGLEADGNHWNYSGMKLIASRMVQKYQSFLTLPPEFEPLEDIMSFGDSITVGSNATANNGYVQQFAANFSQSLNNQAVSAVGVWRMADNVFSNLTTNTYYVTTMTGLNDFRRSGTNTKTNNKLIGCYTSLLVQQWGTNFTNGANPSVTWDNTYFSYTARSLGGKYGTSFPGVPNTTNAGYVPAGPIIKASWNFIGTNVAIGLIGNSGDSETFGTVKIYIDGVLIDTINTNNLYDNISDGTYDNRRGPYAKVYFGLTDTAHTIDFECQGDGYCVLDYFATLIDASACKPVVFCEIPHLNSAGYATSPANANDSILNAASTLISGIVSTFANRGYPIMYYPTNTFYNVTTGISGDNIHPSDTGHAQIFNGLLTYTT